ncbi:MAG: hypothetical protein AABW89_02105 [Nanoarchaeota archaeon]
MKNKKIVLIFTILLLTLKLFLVSAQITESGIKDKIEGLEKAKTIIEKNISNFKVTNNSLTQQWEEYLGNTTFGKFFIEVGNVLTAFNPIWKLFIGIEYSLSWLFFFSLIIAVTFVIMIYRPLKDFFDTNSILTLVITLAILGLISIKKTIPTALESMSFLIPNKWAIIFAIIITYGIAHTYWIMSKKWGQKFSEQRKKDKEKERELREQTLDRVKDMRLRAGKP